MLIYKYRNWVDEYHKNVLKRNEVFMAPAGMFNDPFDCRIPKNFSLLDSEEKKKLYVNKMMNKHKDRIVKMGFDPKEIEKDFEKKLEDLEKLQRQDENLEIKNIDTCYGVLSLSLRWDSILMWSLYGDSHKGYSIGFNEEKLKSSKLFGMGGIVKYSNNFPVRNPLDYYNHMEDAKLQLLHKAKDWSYEEEYRLINLNLNPSPEDNYWRNIKIPNDCIEEINLGLNISKKDREEILDIVSNRNIRVYQLNKEPFKFSLLREELT